jgi:N-methylhydantoinase A
VLVSTDVGGTFTDFVMLERGRVTTLKVPSTPDAPDRAVADGLARIGRRDIRTFSHGTTVATNAVLQRSGARVALVTTEGFEDLLEIGRQARPSVYDLRVVRPEPLTPRELRFGVRERVRHDGSVLEPLTREESARIADAIADTGADAVAVCLLHSYANPEHERMLGESLRTRGLDVSLSSDVRPIFREVERASTTSLDAHVRPIVRGYLARMRESVRGFGPDGFLVMGSHGGVLPDAVAAEHPARLLLSGPAGGVIAAAWLGARAGVGRLFTFDMGGTSTDVGAVVDGAPLRASATTVAGLPLGMPTIDVVTVGAGGGSHVWVDTGGALRVGPRSSGAQPGPAFCGKGGGVPTITDCHVLSGTLPRDFLARYGIAGDIDACRAACERVADEAGVDLDALAMGARRVADATMEGAFRVLLAGRGLDPRDFAMVAFGGAGPLHAAGLAKGLGFSRVVVPVTAGAFSALGIAMSDIVVERDRTFLKQVDEASEVVRGIVRELRREAEAELALAGVSARGARVELEADLRYRGQSHELTVPFAQGHFPTAGDLHRAHQASYGHSTPDEPVELVNLRLRLRLQGPEVRFEGLAPQEGRPAPRETRRALFDEGWLPTPAFERSALGAGASGEGPAVIEGGGETTVVPPGTGWSVDKWGDIWLEGVA